MSLAIAAERRDYWNDVLFEEGTQQHGIHAFHAAREHVIDPLENPGRVGHQRISVGPAQVVGGQSFQEFVGNAIGGSQS